MALEKISTEIEEASSRLRRESPYSQPIDYFKVMAILSTLFIHARESEISHLLGEENYHKLLQLRDMTFTLAELRLLSERCSHLIAFWSNEPADAPMSGRIEKYSIYFDLGDYLLWYQTSEMPTDSDLVQQAILRGRGRGVELTETEAKEAVPDLVEELMGTVDHDKVNQALELINFITSDWD